MMCLVKVHLNKAIDLHMTTPQRTAIHLIQIHAAHRAVGTADRILAAALQGTNMTDIMLSNEDIQRFGLQWIDVEEVK